MKLHDLKPAEGSRKDRKRVGRGPGGTDKTAGRGHKGQKSRSGAGKGPFFEGGRSTLISRLPKRGFVSLMQEDTAEVRLSQLDKVQGEVLNLDALKAAGVVPAKALAAKVILSGKVTRPVKLSGVRVTKGARAAIEAAGGSIEA